MHIKKLLIKDITSKSLLYFDDSQQKECIKIAKYLNIDYLPLIGSFEYAQWKNQGFTIHEITKSKSVSDYNKILDEDVRKKLIRVKNNVLFSAEGRVIKGIVHLSDLNKNIVLQAIQHDMLEFERNLRQWFLLNNITNIDIIKYIENQAIKYPKNSHWQAQMDIFKSKEMLSKLEKHGALQLFNLSLLLDFGNSSLSSKLFLTNNTIQESPAKKTETRTIIIDLRNAAMHAKDAINMNKNSEIHTSGQLKKFYLYLDAFIEKYQELEEKIQMHDKHKNAVIMDNAGKLKIISDHYPNAIEYFIK